MSPSFFLRTFIAATGAILFAAAGFAQTPQSPGNSASNASGSPQAQADPIGATHSDGQSGKSSRPYERDVTMPSDLDKPPQ